MLLPIIMAGGSGTRLWPLSRQLYPKQFHALVGTETMLQATVSRLDGLDAQTPLVICNEEQRFLAAEQMRVAGAGRCDDPARAGRPQHGAGDRARGDPRVGRRP